MNHCIDVACPKCSAKYCPRCESYICPACGHDFPEPVPELDVSCPQCNATFCRHSEGKFCPECGAQFTQPQNLPPSGGTDGGLSGHPVHVNDFLRYRFLCRLLRMFGISDLFRFKIERNDNLVNIWMYHPASGKQDFANLNFDENEEKVAAKFRQIIHKIVFFIT